MQRAAAMQAQLMHIVITSAAQRQWPYLETRSGPALWLGLHLQHVINPTKGKKSLLVCKA